MMPQTPEIVWAGQPRVTGVMLIAKLTKLLTGRVQQAFLFGSHARGEADSFSDVDLILVKESLRPWPERAQEFFDVSLSVGGADILVYNPDEWARLQCDSQGFWATVKKRKPMTSLVMPAFPVSPVLVDFRATWAVLISATWAISSAEFLKMRLAAKVVDEDAVERKQAAT